jgi:hypothetical protein
LRLSVYNLLSLDILRASEYALTFFSERSFNKHFCPLRLSAVAFVFTFSSDCLDNLDHIALGI